MEKITDDFEFELDDWPDLEFELVEPGSEGMEAIKREIEPLEWPQTEFIWED